MSAAAKMSAAGKNGEINETKSSKDEPAINKTSGAKKKEKLVFRLTKPLQPTTPPALSSSTSGQGPSHQNRVEGAHNTLQPNSPGGRGVLSDHSYLPSSPVKLVFRRNNSPKKSWGISAVNSEANSQQGPEQQGSRIIKDVEPPAMNEDDDPKASTSG